MTSGRVLICRNFAGGCYCSVLTGVWVDLARAY